MPFRRSVVVALLLSGLVGGRCAGAPAQDVADTIVARQEAMKRSFEDAVAIRKAWHSGGDLTALAANAREIAATARAIPAMYPPGSGSEAGINTRAVQAIWRDKAAFDRKAADLAAAAQMLVIAVNSGDQAAAGSGLQRLGDACAACHRAYRTPP